MEHRSLRSISDDELLGRLVDLLRQSRRTEAELVAHIGEVDLRRLYAREASPSMFGYCTEVLHLSEAEAYLRIAAARASREHPLLLGMLADGRLHLSGVGKLAPHLSPDNAAELLARAAYKTKRQVAELIAGLAPRPDAPSLMRKLPERAATEARVADSAFSPRRMTEATSVERERPPRSGKPMDGTGADRVAQGAGVGGMALGELRPDAVGSTLHNPSVAVEPLAVGRYKVQFTASATLKTKLERLQALMRSDMCDGDLAAVIEVAVTEKLERLEAKRFGRTSAPRATLERTPKVPGSRHIPAAVRRAVHERDGSRCCYRDAVGRRCSEQVRLEFHHRHPFGSGGDHSPANVALMCRAHNTLMAEHDYGLKAHVRNRGSGWRVGLQASIRSE